MGPTKDVASLVNLGETLDGNSGTAQVLDDPISLPDIPNLSDKSEFGRYIVLIDESSEGDVEDVARDLLDAAGIRAEIKEVFGSINGFVIDLSAEQAERLGADSRVANIEQDGMTPELPLPTEPQLESMERTKTKIVFSKDIDIENLLDRA